MLDQTLEALVHGQNFATLTTLTPQGVPQSSVMWIDCDHEHLLINTEVARAKFRNISHNPVVTVLVWDRDNPYRYVEVRGIVHDTITGDLADEHLEQLARKYTGEAFAGTIESSRVILKIKPTRTRAVD
ncbi:TIGR03618 family F420-dependent PPOX class oxidoreductase [Ferrimicrobium acidiphilum]|jgi:PPOX class probable F420-dependent enzyme|uniref:TIGR03618 family F420-dependent PPOX class oxidoreductase n=1 Tax=Ferrimicrobium acidiphilum TaxID=121039 RepID=UPI0023F3F6E8|nr:TIGR03618 family F420-dependent PPOX class oxidoreductase [Ferrimicrobium acidiphilum]